MDIKTRTQSKITRRMTLSVGEAVRRGIAGLADEVPDFAIPTNATMEVHIPGGGDYSNMSLNADEMEITISWSWEEGGEE